MAALGLRRWLSRLKHRTKKGSDGSSHDPERRLKRWCYRPVLEPLEDRLTVGTVLQRPIVPDGYWVFDGIDTPALALNAIEPSVKAASQGAPAPEIVSLAPPASGQGTSAPPVNRPTGPSEEAAPAFTADASADWSHTPLDSNVFAAMDSVFAAAPADQGGGGAALPDGSPATAGGGGSAGDSGGGAVGAAGAGTSGMGPALNDSSAGTPMSSFSPGGAGSAGLSSSVARGLSPSVKPSPAPAPSSTPNTAAPTLSSAPAPTTSSPSPVTPPAAGVVPISTSPAPTNIVLPPSPPVLHVAQAFGSPGQGRLYLQGSLINIAALGTQVQLDFYARTAAVGQDSDPVAHATDNQSWGTYLGSNTITQTRAGAIDFTVNLKADVAPGAWVGATVHGRSDAPVWANGIVLTASADPFGKGVPAALEALAPHGGDGNNDGVPDASQADVASLPVATTGAFATLVASGHALQQVQVSEAPQTGATLPWGMFSFNVTHVTPGGSAVVKLILPAGSAPTAYYKEDPATGVLMPFNYDGKTGAEIQGNVITLHLVDGGTGDADFMANGVVVDPGGPSTGTNALWSTPLLQAVQPFGSAGPGRVFIEGSVTSGAPIGTTAQIDFYSTGIAGMASTLLGKTSVTRTGTGPISFTSVLKAQVMPGETVVAVVEGPTGTGVQSAGKTVGDETPDMHGIPIALEALGPNQGDGNNDGIPDALQPGVATLPVATTGAFVTLEATGGVLRDVQVADTPPTGSTLPWGLLSFEVAGVLLGGTATVRLVLPAGSNPNIYFKQDPRTGLLTPFTGAEINGNVVTLQLVDGGPGDADGVANGIIVDPGGPGAGTISIPCDNGISGGGWTVIQTGGSGSGVGTVTYDGSGFIITEGNSFEVGLKHDFVIPTSPNILTFDYSNLLFDTASTGRIKDAFEAAFVDANGRSLVPTIASGRDAFLNITEGMPPALGAGTMLVNGVVSVDISKLFATTTGTLVLRLINNDTDTHSTVRISCHAPPGVTIALNNDTAPTGPGSDAFRTDLLTNDPTIAGTATDSAGISKLEAAVDGGAYTDITNKLNMEQYLWYPGALAAGTHTITVRATDTVNFVSTASLTFRVNAPPSANAGGDQTLNEGNLATFDGTLSTDTEAPIFSYLWTLPNRSTSAGAYASYFFVQDGTYTVTLAVTDTAGSVVTNTATITVNNLPPVVASIPDQIISEAGTASFQTTFTDAGTLDTHTATIDWGDGSTSAGTIVEQNGQGTVSGSHVYLEEQIFTATATVTDNGGAAGTSSFIVTVNDAPPVLTISGAGSVNEGTNYTLILQSTQGPDPVSGWTINWGDGSTSTAASTATSASHSFADGPNRYTITATATTDDGVVSTNALVVNVNNIAPAVSISGAASVNEGSVYTLSLSGAADAVDADPITGWSITWGDGNTQAVSGNPSSATHIYLDGPNSYTVSASALDQDGSYSAGSLPVTVNNVAPAVTANNLKGQTNQTLTFSGSFTDPGILDTHTATINWGDNSSNSGTVSESAGNGTVSGTHSYSAAGTYTITLTVTDKDGGATSATSTATITAIAPTLTISGPSSINEGATYTLTLSGSGVTSWTITWGDGNTQNVSGNPASVTHAYSDGPNKVTISATASDGTNTYSSNVVAVTVNAIAPAVSISGASSVNEGSLYTLTLTGTPDSVDGDPITGWKVTWGDGMTQNVNGNPSSATHTYLDGPHTYTISASAIDRDGSYSTNTVTVTVNNVTPTVAANNVSGNEGQTVNFLGTFTDPGVLDTHTATIAWGDNSTSTGTVTELNGSGSVVGTHVYADNGSYTITLSVRDKDNATGTRTATATITNVPPKVTACADPTVVKNVAFTLQVGTFTDPGFTNATAGTQETFTATINWGDGSAAANGTVSVIQGSAGVLTTGTVTGTYTYTTAGDYTVTVTVKDDDNGTGTAQFVIHALAHGATKFYVVDQPAKAIYRYDAAGNPAGATGLATNNQRPWGIVTNGAMDTLWIAEANRNVQVYVYNPDGSLRGNWIADNVPSAQDIATDGTDIWLLDKNGDKVYRFAGGAGWTKLAHHSPTSSFALDAANLFPTGMVTDGTTLWVTDDHAVTNNVFVYNLTGLKLGTWTLDAADGTPSGITLNPNYRSSGTTTDLWTVDRATARVYRYAGASAWRSGNHAATSSFALDAGDQHPEGIADPVVTVQTPANGSAFPQGSPVLVSGQAQTSGGPTLTDVIINNTGATVDAGGDFFQQLTAGAGRNTVTVTATDSSNATATSSLTFTGAGPVQATPTNPGAIDFSMLSDVTASFTAHYGRTSLNNGTSVLYADFTAQNIGSYTVRTPLLVGVRHISAPSVRVRSNTGLMPDDTPFYDLSSLVTSATPVSIGPGQSTQTATLSFYDPEGVQFTYDLVFLGRLNHPPRFTSVPVVTVVAGQTYSYQTTAADPDSDYLGFSKIAGPAGLGFSDSHAGTLSWKTATSDTGTYPIRLRVSDDNGGTADQSFILSVIASGINYPPYFTSEPVVDANVNSLYTYQATAADVDGDYPLQFSLVSAPAGMTINPALTTPASVVLSWTPTVAQIGTQSVTLQVTDGNQASAQQNYSILVQQAVGNHPPIFITTPVTTVAAGSFYVYPSKAIDPDGDPVSYTLTVAPGSMVIDPVTGKIIWQTTSANAGNIYPVTILASDGRGGTATQSFNVTVTSSGPALGALFGTKYSDLNGNGQRDPTAPPVTGLGPIGLKQAPIANTPFALAYHQPTNSMLIVATSGSNTGIYRVQPDGTELLYASLPGLTPGDGTTLTTVQSDNTAGFTVGDIFMPTWSSGSGYTARPQILKVSNGGATVTNPWVTLPTNMGMTTAAATYLDRTGVFQDKLLVLVGGMGSSADIWSVNADGTNTKLWNIPDIIPPSPGECGMITIPDNAALYGSLAGNLLIVQDAGSAIAVNGHTGQVTYPKGPPTFPGYGGPPPNGTGLDSAEGLAIVPAAANFFVIPDGLQSISVADGSQFAPIQGQIVVAHEGGWFDRVWYDGSYLQTQKLAFTADSTTNLPWYEDAFAPVGLGPVKPPPLEPGLAKWTIYLDNNHNGQLDSGEPFTTTDANGNYAFVNLAPGTYTVAEVPQAGWIQKGPAPVPPGTYTVTLAAGQSIYGLDFGNQQDPNPPPPAPPATSDQPPYFTSIAPAPGTATVGVPFLYNATATDPDGGYPLTFDLPVHPDGMAVDPQLGVVAWQPTLDQLGLSASVLLRVTDTQGSVALQSFTVNVAAANTAPIITSSPILSGAPNVLYYYAVKAQDAEHDPLTYSLTTFPQGMSIDSTGAITWTPMSFGGASVTVQVSDGRGGIATQSYTISIPFGGSTNHPPTIISSPRTQTAIGQQYLYQVVATDPDNDRLTYSLGTVTPAPASGNLHPLTVNATTGMLSWTPLAADVQSFTINVTVSDGRGGTFTQTFPLAVTEQALNHPPVITSDPLLAATVGQIYAYNLQGYDPDNDPIFWSLSAGPAGMSVDPRLGTLRWLPQAVQVGSQDVTVRAVDNFGASATQSFTITVRGYNLPPEITSTPGTQAQINKLYTYAIQANDPDGDTLRYSVAGLMGNPTISPTGLLSYTPFMNGAFFVTVTVSDRSADDPQNISTSQTYTLVVSSGSVNHPPIITSQAPTTAVVGTPYQYQVTASDPDPNTTLTYSLSTDVPAGFSSQPSINSTTGLLSWTSPQLNNPPSAPPGTPTNYNFTVTVSDGSLQAQQNYPLMVRINNPPTITSPPVTTVTAGLSYHYDVQASDPDGDALTYSLANPAQSGPNSNVMTIDPETGSISWTPQSGDVGKVFHNITVTVTDPFGASFPQTYDLTVQADTTPPTVELQISPSLSVAVGTLVTFLVFASDDVGVTSMSLTVGSTNVPLDANGQAQLKMNTNGNFTVTAKASDAAGHTTTAPLQTLAVSNPNGTPPTIQPGTDFPALDAIITQPTTMSATVSDDHPGLTYSLLAIPFDGTPTKTITGPSTTGASSFTFSATFDPTLLANGDYTLEIRATDSDDNLTKTLDRHVTVEGKLKLGNYSQNFTDLVVPVSGMSITITRSYDTLQADQVGDFGYGWRMGIADTKLAVSLTAPDGWGNYPAFMDGTHVVVTLPDGRRQGFTFRPWEDSQLFGIIDYWHPSFTPDPGTFSNLTVPDALLSKDLSSDEYFTIEDSGLNSYNPADPTYGGTYTLTNLAGVNYDIDAKGGHLLDMSNRNGIKLAFSDSGIQSSAGKSVTFQRDPQGRIVSVIDPNGKKILYSYDVLGNLASVTDRRGYPTQYQYTVPGQPHFLSAIINSQGVTVMKVLFDATTGRLSGITDAKGHVTPVSYNLNYGSQRFQETTTDPQAHASSTVYDQLGNPVALTDAQNHTTSNTFDDQGNVLVSTDPMTHTTSYNYDAQGRPVSVTDANQQTAYTTYGQFSDIVAQSDPLGNTVKNSYDAHGNLIRSTNALGQITCYKYDAQGMPTTTLDDAGHVVETMAFDTSGNPLTITNASGLPVSRVYDDLGNRKNESYIWVNPNNSTDVHTVMTTANFDEDGNITTTTDGDNNTSTAVYDDLGNAFQFTDNLGRTTHRTFDAAGNLIETQYPNGTIRRAVYDQLNRPVVTDNPHVPGQPTDGFQVVYDEVGREIQKKRLSNVVINLIPDTYNTGQLQSVVDSVGSVIASGTRTYDAAGRLLQSIEPDGMATNYEYDADGREKAITLDALGFAYRTETYYDAAGQVTRSHDPLGHDTRYVYDAAGRVIRTVFASGTFTQTTYNDLGQVVAATDEAGLTTAYQYDVAGHQTAVIEPAVPDPENSGQLTHPVYKYSFDTYGNLSSVTDPKMRNTLYTYDSQGRELSVTLPLGQIESRAYNAKGQLTRATDADGQVVEYIYDTLGRMQTKNLYAAGATTPTQSVAYTYDGLSRQHSVTDTRGTTIFSYDLENHLTQVVAPEGTLNYDYDMMMNRLSRTYTGNPSSPTSDIRYSYDAIGRLSHVTVVTQNGQPVSTNQQTTAYGYDPFTLTSIQRPNGVTTTYVPDVLNRITDVNTTGPSGTISTIHYTLDASGHRIQADENNGGVGRSVHYTYDAVYRLTSEVTNGGAQTVSYVYDLAGNRLQRNDSTAGITNAVYDDDNRLKTETRGNDLKTYSYDPNGALADLVETVSGAQTQHVKYLYDLQQRLASVDTNADGVPDVSYQYDDAGNRVSETVSGATTLFLVDGNSITGYAQVIEEKTPAGSVSASYVHGLDILSQNRNSQNSFYVQDGLGSVRALTNSSGVVTDQYIYDAYGQLITRTGTTTNNYLFAGQQFDPALGEYYLRARYYSPANGRFDRADPLQATDPATLHWYAYTNADPVNKTDPTGLMELGGLMVGIGNGLTLMSLASQAWSIGAKIKTLLDIRDFVMDIREATNQGILGYEEFSEMQSQAAICAFYLIFNSATATISLALDALTSFSYGQAFNIFLVGGSSDASAEVTFEDGRFSLDVDVGQASVAHHLLQKAFWAPLEKLAAGITGVARKIGLANQFFPVGKAGAAATKAEQAIHQGMHNLLISKANPFRLAFPFNTNSAAEIITRYGRNWAGFLADYKKGIAWAAAPPQNDKVAQAILKSKLFGKAVLSVLKDLGLK